MLEVKYQEKQIESNLTEVLLYNNFQFGRKQ